MPGVLHPREYPVVFLQTGRLQRLGNLCAVAVRVLPAVAVAATYRYRTKKKFLPTVHHWTELL